MRNFFSPRSAIPVTLFASLVECIPLTRRLSRHTHHNLSSRDRAGISVQHPALLWHQRVARPDSDDGFRVYNSYKHYVGTVYQEQRAINHNAIVNHVDLLNWI